MPKYQLSKEEVGTAEDAVGVVPQFYRVVLENDRVRVLEFRGKPGDKTEMLSHPALVHQGLTDGERIPLP